MYKFSNKAIAFVEEPLPLPLPMMVALYCETICRPVNSYRNYHLFRRSQWGLHVAGFFNNILIIFVSVYRACFINNANFGLAKKYFLKKMSTKNGSVVTADCNIYNDNLFIWTPSYMVSFPLPLLSCESWMLVKKTLIEKKLFYSSDCFFTYKLRIWIFEISLNLFWPPYGFLVFNNDLFIAKACK